MLTAKAFMLKLIFTHILKQSVQYQGGGSYYSDYLFVTGS